MNNFYTYLYTDPSRNEPIYVGKGCRKRAWAHLNRTDDTHFARRLAKMKRKGVEPVISFLAENVNEHSAHAIEIFWIAVLGRADLQLGPLLNKTRGGDGGSPMTGRCHSEETKEKMRTARLGLHHSEETKAKLRNIVPSAEARAKNSMAHKGKTLSAEHCAKLRAANVGHQTSNDTRSKISKALNRQCTVGDKIYPSRKELIAALGQGKLGLKHPNFRYIGEIE